MPTEMPLVVFATAKALPGKEAALQAALVEVATPTRAQPGCISFELFRSADGALLTAVEHWTSRADHDAHTKGPHVQTLMAKFDGVLAGPPSIVAMAPIEA